ncbi:MAG: hydantoinase B/oxoprolinase family protein, partial [Rhodospirillales bacterium]|nr:hydantoinase B/oxoprolinase family protein [Rhodospirillales bacterium]
MYNSAVVRGSDHIGRRLPGQEITVPSIDSQGWNDSFSHFQEDRLQDLVQLELIRESLIAVVGEMRANIIHSSYAPIIYEGHDFSCALMSADGRQVAQG